MAKYFGTDGIRGPFGGDTVTPTFFRRVGEAVGRVLPSPRRAILGRDPRPSGPELSLAIAEGLLAAGWEVVSAGIVPTPAIALAVARRGDVGLGVMITASHNPASDNGVKFFDKVGAKLDDAVQALVERHIEETLPGTLPETPIEEDASVREGYRAALENVAQRLDLRGRTIVVDAAHGATRGLTSDILRSHGAEVIAVGEDPHGAINNGVGSEHPATLAEAVRSHGADLGIAHDGDGDRAVLVDETGAVVPGEVLLALWAEKLAKEESPESARLVTTVQSNLGLDAFLRDRDIEVLRTDVGDRHVAARMRETGAVLGGEASGHFLFLRESPSGDGPLAALHAIELGIKAGEPFSRLVRRLPLFPQITADVRVEEKIPLEGFPGWTDALSELERELGDDGRVLARYSGTEPKLRLLVEARDAARARQIMTQLRETAHRLLPVHA